MLTTSPVEAILRFAAQWFAIESIFSKVRLCEMSKAAFLVAAVVALVNSPEALVESTRKDWLRLIPAASAAALASSARRFISSWRDWTALSEGCSCSSETEAVELVEANNAPGMLKVKAETGAVDGRSLAGDPKTKGEVRGSAYPSIARGTGCSAMRDRRETGRMPPSGASSGAGAVEY